MRTVPALGIVIRSRTRCQKQQILKCYNQCWLYLLCCTIEAVVKEILKNDARVTKRKRKKFDTFVRQCWYILTSWIFVLFHLNFVHVSKQHKMSALSETNSKKYQCSLLYDCYTRYHKNSYYSKQQILLLGFIYLSRL